MEQDLARRTEERTLASAGQTPHRYTLPEPYRELDHTADVGVEVEGRSLAEVVARLVLAEAALLAGGGAVLPDREELLEVKGEDLTRTALALLRELLYRFATARVIAASCTVHAAGSTGLAVLVELGPYDPVAHAEGHDLKAVTRHEARCAEEGDLWRARVIFDL